MTLSIGSGITIGGGINFLNEGAATAPATVEYLVVAGGGGGGGWIGGGGSDGRAAFASGGGGNGGSGIVVIRYEDTYADATSTEGLAVGYPVTSGGYKIYKWITSGSITF